MATTAVLNNDGRQAYASPGAVRQHGGSLPIRRCGTCGQDVVWCTSKKTGRKYLVNVSRGYLDQRFYVGSDFHDCAKRLAEIEAVNAKVEVTESKRVAMEWLEAQRTVLEELADAGAITREQYLAGRKKAREVYDEMVEKGTA